MFYNSRYNALINFTGKRNVLFPCNKKAAITLTESRSRVPVLTYNYKIVCVSVCLYVCVFVWVYLFVLQNLFTLCA